MQARSAFLLHRRLAAALALTLSVLALVLGGWYARAHYWLPRKHLEAAQRASERRDFGEARRELDQYLEAYPKDPRGHFLLARTCRRANDLDQAEEHLIACEQLQGGHPDPQIGNTKLEWALLDVRRGKILEMEAYLRRRLRDKDPDSPLILEAISWELLRRNRLQEALAALNQWLEMEPGEPEILVRRGWVAEHLLDFNRAIEDYGQAVALQPERDSVRLRLAELLVDSNRPQDAMEHLNSLRLQNPHEIEVDVCYARALRLQGQAGEAQQLLDQILAGNPSHLETLTLRAQLAMEAGQTDQAAALLERALALEPLNRQLNYTLLQCLKRLGKTEKIKEIEKRLEQAEAQLRRLDDLIKKVTEKPYDPSLRFEVGMIFLKNGKARDGIHWLVTALETDPTHRPTHEALAAYYDTTGDKTQAEYHRAFLR